MGSVDKAAIGWTIAIVIAGAGIAVAGIGYDYDDKMMKEMEFMNSGMSDYQMEKMMEDGMDKEMSAMEKMMEKDRMSSGMMDKEMSAMEKMMKEDKMSSGMMDKEMSAMEKMMKEDKMSSKMMDDAMMSMSVSIPTGTSVTGCEETSECFIPYEASVSVGGSVTWANDDTAAHTVTSGSAASGPDGNFDSSILPSSGSFTVEFDDSGSFDYFCLVHPWMAGVVSVN